MMNEDVLNKLYNVFNEIVKRCEAVPLGSKYGEAQKKLAHAQRVMNCIEEYLLSIELNEPYDENELLKMIMQEHDGNSIMIEIRAAAGGDEASLFVLDLLNMYRRYGEKCKWQCTILESNENDVGGYKTITVNIKGKNVYEKLFLESGVHRVQRIPATESKGRIHTSTVSVYIYNEPTATEFAGIQDKDLEISFCRSSGAGGQHVNTTDSAVRIKHKPTGLVVECQNERSQHMNKASAMKVLAARLYDLQRQQERSSRNSDRSSFIGNSDRSEKIRTYNYPQNRLTDHRYNIHSSNLNNVMDGDLEDFLNQISVQYTLQYVNDLINL